MKIREFVDTHTPPNRETDILYICSEVDGDYTFVADNGLTLEQSKYGDYEVAGYKIEERAMYRTKRGRDVYVGKIIVYRIQFTR